MNSEYQTPPSRPSDIWIPSQNIGFAPYSSIKEVARKTLIWSELDLEPLLLKSDLLNWESSEIDILGNPGVTHSVPMQWVRNGSRLGYRGWKIDSLLDLQEMV